MSQTHGVMTVLKLSPETQNMLRELTLSEVRSIMKEGTVESSRRTALYISGTATVAFGVLSVLASLLNFNALSEALVTPTAVGAISAATLAYLVSKEAS